MDIRIACFAVIMYYAVRPREIKIEAIRVTL